MTEPIAPSLDDSNANDLINAILDGSWDLYLSDIVKAVGERRDLRKDELQAKVYEVYGPGYEITLRK